jgi:hypothetical protein
MTTAEVEARLVKLERQLQSANDKATAAAQNQAQVKADLDSMRRFVELQKQAGVQITPEQEAHMQQQVINQAFSQAAPTTAVTSPQPASQQSASNAMPQVPDRSEIEDVNNTAVEMMQLAGVTIQPGDPRVKANGTKAEFFSSLYAAIEQDKQRLGEIGRAHV